MFHSLSCYSTGADRSARSRSFWALPAARRRDPLRDRLVRVNERVVGIFSVAHLASLTAIAVGIALLLKSRHLLWMKQRLA